MVSLTFRGHKARVPKTFTSLQVREEGQDERSFNRWTNRDIIPVPPEERNYGPRGYFGFWCVKANYIGLEVTLIHERVAAAANSSAWSMGSANLANGLTAGETIGMVFLGSCLAGVMAFIGGEPGVSSKTLNLKSKVDVSRSNTISGFPWWAELLSECMAPTLSLWWSAS